MAPLKLSARSASLPAEVSWGGRERGWGERKRGGEEENVAEREVERKARKAGGHGLGEDSGEETRPGLLLRGGGTAVQGLLATNGQWG